MEWYYILGIISYSVFIVQATLAMLGSDFDFDIDIDGDIDFDGGDIFTFKGFLHFILGFSTWLMTCDHYDIYNENAFIFYGCAIIVGALFMYILTKAYKFCLNLNYTPESADASNMIGIVYLCLGESDNMYKYTLTVPLGSGTIQVDALSKDKYGAGDTVRIGKKINGVYYIIGSK